MSKQLQAAVHLMATGVTNNKGFRIRHIAPLNTEANSTVFSMFDMLIHHMLFSHGRLFIL